MFVVMSGLKRVERNTFERRSTLVFCFFFFALSLGKFIVALEVTCEAKFSEMIMSGHPNGAHSVACLYIVLNTFDDIRNDARHNDAQHKYFIVTQQIPCTEPKVYGHSERAKERRARNSELL